MKAAGVPARLFISGPASGRPQLMDWAWPFRVVLWGTVPRAIGGVRLTGGAASSSSGGW